jgi:hypothetical protein
MAATAPDLKKRKRNKRYLPCKNLVFKTEGDKLTELYIDGEQWINNVEERIREQPSARAKPFDGFKGQEYEKSSKKYKGGKDEQKVVGEVVGKELNIKCACGRCHAIFIGTSGKVGVYVTINDRGVRF